MFKFENCINLHLQLVRITAAKRGQYFFKGVAIYQENGIKKARKIGVRFNPFNSKFWVYKFNTLRAEINKKDPLIKTIEESIRQLIENHSNRKISNTNLRSNLHAFLDLLLDEEVETAHHEAIPKQVINNIIENVQSLVKGNAPIKYSDKKNPTPYFSDSTMGQYWLEDRGEAQKGIDYK